MDCYVSRSVETLYACRNKEERKILMLLWSTENLINIVLCKNKEERKILMLSWSTENLINIVLSKCVSCLHVVWAQQNTVFLIVLFLGHVKLGPCQYLVLLDFIGEKYESR